MARSNEPLWWGPFSAGMMVGALVVPALILLTGFWLPWLRPGGGPATQQLVNHGLTRLFLFVVISLSLFHFAHRTRYVIFDLGVRGGKEVVAFLCYGSAIVGTVVAGLIALHIL